MQIKEYVGRILSSISANPYVESQSISCQERPPDGAYLDKEGDLIFSYDNALDPMARGLSSYPEHRHAVDGLSPAMRPLFEEVLEEISEQVRQRARA